MSGWKISRSDAALLKSMTQRLLSVSLVKPEQVISRGRNTTGTALLTPGCNSADHSTYPAFWVRDPGWIAESGFVEAQDIWGWLLLISGTMQGHSPRVLASGGVILPYSIADHINVDGSAVFYPGTYASDDTQGPPYGMYPPHDDQYWLTITAYAYAKLISFYNPLASNVNTAAGELPLWQVCALTHEAFPVEPKTQLCIASENTDQHIVDWGYNDTVTKTGRLLFPSLLRFESALKLAHIFEGLDMHDEADMYRAQVTLLRRSIIETFYSEDERHEGWLFSATGIGNKPDVWGSAYAIYLGLLPEELMRATAASLLRGYRERTTVLQGQVRHIPTTYGYWEMAQCAPGTYQNGGYWAYPVGWYVYTLAQIDETAAAAMFSEYLGYIRQSWDDSFRSGAWECINPELNHYQNPGYLASVALPYVTLRNKGLITD